MRYQIIENGKVINTAVADSPQGDNWIESDVAGPGWLYQDGIFSAPPVVIQNTVPAKVTRRQARQALLLAGKLSMVEPAINAIPDATQRALIMIEWQDSLEFERKRPSLIMLATAIGMTSADLDALFVQASKL